MKIRIDVTADTDLAALVHREDFTQNMDQHDLADRESAAVHDWYHKNWFRQDDFGALYFTPPAFEYRADHLMCINGRHRTVLLFRHQTLIPMLIVRPDLWPSSMLARFSRQVVEKDETVEIPDLPINCDAPNEFGWPDSQPRQLSTPKVDVRITFGDDELVVATPEEEK